MPTATPTAFCPAGVFTPVNFYFLPVPLIGFTWVAPGATVTWRYFSSGPPFYATGVFRGRGCIRLGVGTTTLLEFNPNINVTVTSVSTC
jgi:hypothetical protein